MSEPHSESESVLPVSNLVETFLAGDRAAFLEAFPYPLVLTDDLSDGNDEAHFHTLRVEKPGAVPGAPNRADRLLEQVGRLAFPLRKKSRFASMITLGRAAGSDIRINVSSVSKFHAYFTHVAREQAWYLSDAKSSNGTFVGGEELEASDGKLKLESGATLRFGPDVSCRFFTPEGLWSFFTERFQDTPS